MRVAVVGPTHPLKGGVAAHTTSLAHHLQAAGHEVTLVSWTHLYPSRLYPGQRQAVPAGSADVPPFQRTVRVLSWARPDSWVRAGRHLRDMDVVVLVHVVPAVVPAHLALLAAAARRDGGPRTVVVAHNVLPHEPHPGARPLVAALLRRVEGVLVHSPEEAHLARSLGARRAVTAPLPPHLPGGPPLPRSRYDGPPRLLALGMIRRYKGLELLLRAMMQVRTVRLTVAGESWGSAGASVEALAREPSLQGRVFVRSGYVPADEIAPLLAEHDVLALTYTSATASQNVLLAHEHGLVVLASAIGTFADQVRDGVDGLLVPPGDEAALVAALVRLSDPDLLRRLREGVRRPDLEGPWSAYLRALDGLVQV